MNNDPIPRAKCAVVITGIHGLVTESWSQGFMAGGLLILFFVAVANMRRGVLLHKLIALELILASIHGTFIFVNGPAAGWYTSGTAVCCYISYNLHNIINWIKVKPFLNRWASMLYIGTVALVCPYWIAEMYFNFAFNNDLAGYQYFPHTRPWEALCREPWWWFTAVYLIVIIKRSYSCDVFDLVRTSGRFVVLLLAMVVSIIFVVTDVVTVLAVSSPCAGENPFWKIAQVFKCIADTIFLDDFKSVLDRLSARAQRKLGSDTTIAPLEKPSRPLSRVFSGPTKPRSASTNDVTSRSYSTCQCHCHKTDFLRHVEVTDITPRRNERRPSVEWWDAIEPA